MTSQSEKIMKCFQFILSEYAYPLNDLAELLCISPETLSEIIQKKTDMPSDTETLTQWQNQLNLLICFPEKNPEEAFYTSLCIVTEHLDIQTIAKMSDVTVQDIEACLNKSEYTEFRIKHKIAVVIATLCVFRKYMLKQP